MASATSSERRRRLTRRGLPVLVGLALLALAAGVVLGSLAESAAERTARDFTRAWERSDWPAMHDLLTGEAQSRYDVRAFERAYRDATATATATAIRAGSPRGEDGGEVPVPVTVETRVFGPLRGELRVPVEEDRVAWAPHLTFPAVPEGMRLTRRSEPPERARLLSRDRKVLAEGPATARSSPQGGVGSSVAGSLEPEKEARDRQRVYARGFPRSWPVGQTGLERVFENTLGGRPAAELLAGERVLARAPARPGRDVRTTIDTRLQESAVSALGGRLGGIAALDADTAQVRALAGIAFSAPQPPGSTFKIVTTTAALEAKAVKTSTNFPVDTEAVIDGVALENANGESCGGTFQNSFAHSCNSVFAPLGVKVGARRLVAAAERFGFNQPPAVPGEVPSTIPPAGEIRSPLEVGSTAIGQGKVLATPLRLASMAQVVATGGVRTEPSLRRGGRRRPVRVMSRRVARTLERLMIDVVAYGTGTAAAVPGVQVAGKTGTAELKDTRGPDAETTSDPENTDAWFTAYAPARRPRIAVAALFVRAGAGGQTAAPAVQTVLATALE